MIQQGAVAIGSGIHAVKEVREQFHVIGVDLRFQIGDLLLREADGSGKSRLRDLCAYPPIGTGYEPDPFFVHGLNLPSFAFCGLDVFGRFSLSIGGAPRTPRR